MKFTIVTPSYQQGDYLARTIESVLIQAGPTVELEYFILDNCSEDGTQVVLDHYAHRSNITIIRSPDQGQADAINRGWALGTGDIFAWLNADDVYLPNALKTVANYFETRSDLNALYGEAIYIDAQDQVLKPVTNIRNYSKSQLKIHEFITQPATFLRRDVVETTGQLAQHVRYVFDWDYWIRVSKCYEFVRVSEPLAGYRVTGQNLTSTGKGKRFREMLNLVWHYGGIVGMLQFGLRILRKRLARQVEMPAIKPMTSTLTSESKSRSILGCRVDGVDYDSACDRIETWVVQRQSGYVIAANVHVIMTAYWNRAYQSVVNQAVLVTPDGMPLVLGLRLLGNTNQTRVYGPDLMLRWCDRASRTGLPIYLYGSSWETLETLEARLLERFPTLIIAGAYSPKFGELSEAERQMDCDRINASGASVVFVALGCPKQEWWMAQAGLDAVAIGVGAAFRFHTGEVAQAPRWMMGLGLEWVYRLCQEPRRLWRRYVINNPAFLVLFGWQVLLERVFKRLG